MLHRPKAIMLRFLMPFQVALHRILDCMNIDYLWTCSPLFSYFLSSSIYYRWHLSVNTWTWPRDLNGYKTFDDSSSITGSSADQLPKRSRSKKVCNGYGLHFKQSRRFIDKGILCTYFVENIWLLNGTLHFWREGFSTISKTWNKWWSEESRIVLSRRIHS